MKYKYTKNIVSVNEIFNDLHNSEFRVNKKKQTRFVLFCELKYKKEAKKKTKYIYGTLEC